MARLDAVEERHSQLEHKVDGLNTGMEQLTTNMGTQFSQVLQAIADLSTAQQKDGKKRSADQPPPS